MERWDEMDFRIGQDTDGLFIKKFQDIPSEFLDRNRKLRDISSGNNANEYHQVASIPEVIVDKWLREGFDVYKESIKACVARLKQENLDYFVTTTKRI